MALIVSEPMITVPRRMSALTGMIHIMSFPTHQDLDAVEHWLLARGVANAIAERRADLAERVVLVEDLPSPAVKVTLSGGRCIVFARATESHVTAWVIATPDGEVTTVAESGGVEAIAARIVAACDRFAH